MITANITGITFLKNEIELNPSVQIKIEGHSFLADYGNDIVCAGVSALALTAIKAISLVAKLNQKVHQESGKLISEISLGNCDDLSKTKFITILETLLIGLNEIKLKYPDRIEIHVP